MQGGSHHSIAPQNKWRKEALVRLYIYRILFFHTFPLRSPTFNRAYSLNSASPHLNTLIFFDGEESSLWDQRLSVFPFTYICRTV
jgi:hypothetical protein